MGWGGFQRGVGFVVASWVQNGYLCRMKTFIALVVFALAASFSFAQAAPADLKSAVAAWFDAEQQIGFVRVKMTDVVDGKMRERAAKDIREEWPKFATAWQGQLIGFVVHAKDTPGDRTILASMRAAHRALEEAKTDKAKVDQALRRLGELRLMVR